MARKNGVIREFSAGFAMLLRGAGMWRTHRTLLLQGLLPALIAGVVLLALLIPSALSLGSITSWVTPFATDWTSPWREIFRVTIGIVLFIAALAAAGALFSAVALTIGDSFYQRIWRGTEEALGGSAPQQGSGFWTSLSDGLQLGIRGILIAALTFALGFIPGVGGIVAAITGFCLSARLLAQELTTRAFDARGIRSSQHAAVLRKNRARVLGFGVATQLCFLIPLGAVVGMPAAVAGSTMLARSLLDDTTVPVHA